MNRPRKPVRVTSMEGKDVAGYFVAASRTSHLVASLVLEDHLGVRQRVLVAVPDLEDALQVAGVEVHL